MLDVNKFFFSYVWFYSFNFSFVRPSGARTNKMLMGIERSGKKRKKIGKIVTGGPPRGAHSPSSMTRPRRRRPWHSVVITWDRKAVQSYGVWATKWRERMGEDTYIQPEYTRTYTQAPSTQQKKRRERKKKKDGRGTERQVSFALKAFLLILLLLEKKKLCGVAHFLRELDPHCSTLTRCLSFLLYSLPAATHGPPLFSLAANRKKEQQLTRPGSYTTQENIYIM